MPMDINIFGREGTHLTSPLTASSLEKDEGCEVDIPNDGTKESDKTNEIQANGLRGQRKRRTANNDGLDKMNRLIITADSIDFGWGRWWLACNWVACECC
jgi:hypothetical protein